MSKARSRETKMKGILTDVTKCIGCERCVQACNQVNKLPPDLPTRFKVGDGLSNNRLTSIVRVPGTSRTVRKQCLHCIEPSCASACLVGAFHKREDGPVVYEESECIGCRYCMLACPFMIPRYEWDKTIPYVRKCKMDEECRVEGGMPACVSACPTGATIFGDRDELIKEARRRIKEKPGLYIDHIWGEHEFGGTSVLYISDVPLGEVLRIPSKEELAKRAVPELATGSIPHMNHSWVMVTPFQFGIVFSGLFGIWVIRRRSQLQGPHDRGGPGAPEPGAAGLDEVCQEEPSEQKNEGGE